MHCVYIFAAVFNNVIWVDPFAYLPDFKFAAGGEKVKIYCLRKAVGVLSEPGKLYVKTVLFKSVNYLYQPWSSQIFTGLLGAF